jgi:hypothetical protein
MGAKPDTVLNRTVRIYTETKPGTDTIQIDNKLTNSYLGFASLPGWAR